MWEKEQVFLKIQENGKKITQQREILIDVILENQWHTNKEIYYEALKRDKGIGKATVYRTMELLEEVGVLKRCSQYQLA